jgi:glyoxylase-like metal-dependent hydrolase (beta-lactamase superfamily II)
MQPILDDPEEAPMSSPLTQLTAHLWVAQSSVFVTNSGLFLSQGQAGLIDPGILPQEIAAIARFLAEQGARPTALVITHSHWDHILGPEHFPGVHTVAQESYRAEVSQGAGFIQQQIAQWETESQVERTRPFVIPTPDETFAGTTTLAVGDQVLHLTHAPGHAADELVVYHAASAALWAGDMLSDLEIPFVSHSLAAYEHTLAMLAGWEVRVLVPGHGNATTSAAEIAGRVAADRAYLADLRGRVERALGEGQTVEETVAGCSGMRFRHPEGNAGPHRLNVESAYIELGGQADPTRVGWHWS